MQQLTLMQGTVNQGITTLRCSPNQTSQLTFCNNTLSQVSLLNFFNKETHFCKVLSYFESIRHLPKLLIVITMCPQTTTNKHAAEDVENQISALKTRIETQEKELTRVATAMTEKSTILRSLLDQIYALEIDPGVKRVMTGTCLHLIDKEITEKRLNMELTESDSVFLSKLQKKHPNLSQRELRISVLVRLNYDTKEIARSVGITTRGMESIRYRMHHKLGLGKHESIKSYLSNLALS